MKLSLIAAVALLILALIAWFFVGKLGTAEQAAEREEGVLRGLLYAIVFGALFYAAVLIFGTVFN